MSQFTEAWGVAHIRTSKKGAAEIEYTSELLASLTLSTQDTIT